MAIYTLNLPDISDYMEYLQTVQLGTENTVLLRFKTCLRSDDVFVDIFLNEISEDTKIISGRKMTPNSMISIPNSDNSLQYSIHCVDIDDTLLPINKYNLNKFMLFFQSTDKE